MLPDHAARGDVIDHHIHGDRGLKGLRAVAPDQHLDEGPIPLAPKELIGLPLDVIHRMADVERLPVLDPARPSR